MSWSLAPTERVPGRSLAERDETDEIAATSFHPSPIGGGVLIGRGADGQLRRVVIATGTAARDPQPGETWRVTGPSRTHPEFGVQIHARVSLPLLPSGRTIVRYLATNVRLPGVGWKTADRLWSTLGERLYDVVGSGDVDAIARVIGAERAISVVTGFGLLADEVEVFRWLDRYGVSPRTAAAAAGLWGRGAIRRIAEDPYALALLEPWRSVDERAFRLGVSPDDRRRRMAAIDEVFSRRWKAGRTAATDGELTTHCSGVLGPRCAISASQAVREAVESGRIIRRPNGLLQGRAAWFMEREIERTLCERLARPRTKVVHLNVDEAVRTFEASSGYPLSPGQREAVRMAASSPMSVLCGGAGTGKTTAVRAVLAASDRARAALPAVDQARFGQRQVALSGRAAKRIAEATGRQASTVSRFLRRLEAGADPIRRGLLVVDEASMIDIPLLYRILVALPADVDLLFVGDPGQLPPIGPGAPFHQLVKAAAVPRTTLDIVHRQSERTGIPAVAGEIRAGRLPDLPRFDPGHPLAPGVFLVPAAREGVGEAALGVFRAMVGQPPALGRANALHDMDVQILCLLKNGPGGSKVLNEAVEREWMACQEPVPGWGLSVGSKVMWLHNDYGKSPLRGANGEQLLDPVRGEPMFAGFTNGALGMVCRLADGGAWLEFDDGAADRVHVADLEHLTRGWAISVHKAQGSAFRRVVIPVSRSRILDRALLYTAVTRGVETVVLVGDPAELRRTVEAPPGVSLRPETLSLDPPILP